MIIKTPPKPKSHSRENHEAKIQAECVLWLWNNRPETRGLYFCVPNENTQSVYESKRQQMISGSKRKSMGVVSGTSDTILFIPRKGYHALCIEYKTPSGHQSPSQVLWQKKVEEQGYCYVIVRSLQAFITVIKNYLD